MQPDSASFTYRVLAGVARIAARWHYRTVEVDGAARIPGVGPVLLVVNHPNELMDAIFAALVSPRQLTFTGKATLFEHPVSNAFLRYMRVVPLRRVVDERTAGSGARSDASRNAESFAAIHAALAAGEIVLVFPEGRSWDEPRLAPIKTGAARMALSARDAGITDVRIVPIGINYEKKDGLRSRVLVEVGQPIAVDLLTPEAAQVDTLTAEIARRLSAVTLNFDDERDSLEVLDLATILAAATTEIRPLGEPDASVATTVDVARRTDQIRSLLERGELPLRVEERVRRIQRRLMALNRTARKLDIRLADVALDTRLPAAVRFVVRELLLGVFGVPIALWGRITHLLPFTLATSLGARTSRSRSERAMNTILLGLALVPMAYGIQTFIVWRLAGPWWSALYLASLIPSASWNLVYTERLTQLRRRVLAWRHFRQDPGLQEKLRSELFALRDEAAGIASALAP